MMYRNEWNEETKMVRYIRGPKDDVEKGNRIIQNKLAKNPLGVWRTYYCMDEGYYGTVTGKRENREEDVNLRDNRGAKR